MLKTGIVDELGENPLLLPAYVEQALEANNRLKYYFTLLQEAQQFADHPEAGAADLRTERAVAGITDSSLDSIIANAQRTTDGHYYIPQVIRLHGEIVSALETMLTPVQAGMGDGTAIRFRQRLDKLLADIDTITGDEVSAGYIEHATHGRRDHGDSLHLLVMDLHRVINQLQSELAQETLDGARAYGLADSDRRLVKAFMSGLNRTAPLKFDHPGLDTTATRHDNRLIIENDIGTTDAHVLVIHVDGLRVTMTYTDIHEQRAAFFEQLFEQYNVDWQDTRSRDRIKGETKGRYFLCTGMFNAGDDKTLCNYLAFLGSRIVYLIDWNKARKRLRNFIRKRDCLALLKWAADNDVGHRGFLQAGGERIIYEALAQVTRAENSYGERLDSMLGEAPALEFLRFVLQTASSGLLNGRSERLIRDEIKTEIFNYFQSAGEGIYEICADHAATVFDLADATRNILTGGIDCPEDISRMAVLAKRRETRADDLLNRVREITRRTGDGLHMRRITEQADNVADCLEEVAYLLTLLPAEPLQENMLQPLQALSGLVVEGVRGYIRCIEATRQLKESNTREDRQAFLEAVDDIITIEHQTDAEERRLLKLLLQESRDARQMHLLGRLGQTFEEAADALALCALVMKDYVIDEVMTP